MKLPAFQWSKLSFREKILFFLTVGAILYAAVFLLYLPKAAERRQLHAEKTALEQEVKTLSLTLPTLAQKIDEDGPRSSSETGALFLALSDDSLSKVLEEIAHAARSRDVQLLDLRPGVIEKRDTYDVLPIQLKTRSRFHNFDRYLATLEKLPRPVIVDRMKIETTQETTPDVVVEMSLLVYMKGGV